jgi:hypothetical protein
VWPERLFGEALDMSLSQTMVSVLATGVSGRRAGICGGIGIESEIGSDRQRDSEESGHPQGWFHRLRRGGQK